MANSRLRPDGRPYQGPSHLLTHARIHAFTHSHTRALTHSRTHALTHSRTYSFTHLITPSITHSLTQARADRMDFAPSVPPHLERVRLVRLSYGGAVSILLLLVHFGVNEINDDIIFGHFAHSLSSTPPHPAVSMLSICGVQCAM